MSTALRKKRNVLYSEVSSPFDRSAKNMQAEILVKIHTGLQGIEKYRLRARETVYWCGINGGIDKEMRCLSTQPNSAAKGRNDPYRYNIYPWEIVGSDMFHFRGE